MSVLTNWSSSLAGDILFDLRRHFDIEHIGQDVSACAGTNRESDAKDERGLFNIVLPMSGTIIRPRVSTSVAFLLLCVAIGGGVTSIFLHFGKLLAIGHFPAVLSALVTILALYFFTSRLFVGLLTSTILGLPKHVFQLFFEEQLLGT